MCNLLRAENGCGNDENDFNCRKNRHYNCIDNYGSSFMSLNNGNSRRSRRSYHNIVCNRAETETCWPELRELKRASNQLASKVICVIFAHIFCLYIILTYCRHFKLTKTDTIGYITVQQITLLVYLIVYFVLVTFATARTHSPLNYALFVCYTLVTASMYATNLAGLDQFLSLVFLVILASQLFLLLFVLVQSKFTLFSRPLLPYFYIYALSIATTVIVLLVIQFGIKFRLFLTPIGAKNSQDWLFGDFFMIEQGEVTLINWRKIGLAVFLAFLFDFYEIFDLQFVLADSSPSPPNDCSINSPQFFLIAFNLLTVDLFKLFLVFISSLLNLIK